MKKKARRRKKPEPEELVLFFGTMRFKWNGKIIKSIEVDGIDVLGLKCQVTIERPKNVIFEIVDKKFRARKRRYRPPFGKDGATLHKTSGKETIGKECNYSLGASRQKEG